MYTLYYMHANPLIVSHTPRSASWRPALQTGFTKALLTQVSPELYSVAWHFPLSWTDLSQAPRDVELAHFERGSLEDSQAYQKPSTACLVFVTSCLS